MKVKIKSYEMNDMVLVWLVAWFYYTVLTDNIEKKKMLQESWFAAGYIWHDIISGWISPDNKSYKNLQFSGNDQIANSTIVSLPIRYKMRLQWCPDFTRSHNKMSHFPWYDDIT